MKRTALAFRLLALWLLMPFNVAVAQSYLNATGNPSFGVNIPTENGFINVTNGNLHMEFHMATLKQRGALNLDEKLVYDSRIWTIVNSGTSSWQPSNVPNTPYAQGGWRFISGTETGVYSLNEIATSSTQCSGPYGPPHIVNSYVPSWTDSSGTLHAFDTVFVQDINACVTPNQVTWSGSNPGWATDSSGYNISVSSSGTITVVDNQATQVYPQMTDRYGNYWSTDSNSNLIDDLGRTPVIVTTSANVTYYDVLAPNGTINNNGTRVRYTVTTAPVTVSTQFNQSGVTEWSGTLNPVQSIQLPDGSSYSFAYDLYGELSSVTLPTGGVIYYGWSNYLDSYQNENRWLTSRTVGSNPAMTLTPSVPTQCPTGVTVCQQVVLHKPSGDETLYQFTLNNGAWNTNVTAYNGSTSGTALIGVANTYDYSHTCQTQACTGPEYITKSTATTTLLDANVSTQTQYGYSNPALGKPTSLKQWDYYTPGSQPATPTSETDYSYSSTGFDLTQATQFDSGHNQVGQTTYGYTTSATATTGVPQHGTANAGGPYLQSVSQWINTNNSQLATTYAMDDTGMVTGATDPSGKSSSVTYQCSNALPSQATNALGQTTTYGYDCNSGAITSVKDPNDSAAGRSGTVYQYENQAGRLQSVAYPDGGLTTYSYTSPTQTGVSSKINASQNSDQETFYDGFGRVIRSAVFNGSAWYLTDSCYDANSRLQSQSVPYSSTAYTGAEVCSGSVISYTYDGLDRTTNVNNADGNTQYQYAGRAVKVTDVNGVQKITQSDALGRTTGICEVSGSTLQGDAPQSCGLDSAGTGFLTSYAYDLLNHKATITQGVQTRIFQSDSLGRPVLMQEPESGQTTYSYAYNSTGLQVIRTRPRANQTNPATTTTTTAQYDDLGRPLSVTYNDGTPSKSYAYDVSENWPGFTQSNMIGRLSEGSDFTGGNWAAELFTYDSMGRVAGLNECTPSTCGNNSYNRQLPYTYDLAGNLSTSGDGAGVTTTYAYSNAAQVTAISSSMSGATYPSSLVSGLNEGPYGPMNYQLGNGLDANFLYDSLGRLYGGWVCVNTFQPNCTGGNGQIYGFNADHRGVRVTATNDTAVNQHRDYSYDDFNRLSYTNIGNGQQTFSYVYDRYGNRWQQNAPQGGPAPSYTFNKANNQISSYAYDAAGNMTNDGFHSYTYDAEGNITQVDGGSTATYSYDAFNQRVRVAQGSTTTEYVFNLSGQRVSIWDGNSHAQLQGQYYWGSTPIAFYQGGSLHFQHQDWQGTERVRTSYNGSVEGSYSSLPWGDGYSASGADADPYHFAQLDHDPGSNTEHAQFRQLSATQGRWMSPDPYNGSYDVATPQSFNRYAYVLNSPLSLIDPMGLSECKRGEPCNPGIPPGTSCPTDPPPPNCVYNCDSQKRYYGMFCNEGPPAGANPGNPGTNNGGNGNPPSNPAPNNPAPNNGNHNNNQQRPHIPRLVCGVEGCQAVSDTYPGPGPCKDLDRAGDALQVTAIGPGGYAITSSIIVFSGGAALVGAPVAAGAAFLSGTFGRLLNLAAKYHIGCTP